MLINIKDMFSYVKLAENLTHGPRISKFGQLFTDSQATLQALHSPHVTSKLIEDTIAQLKPIRGNS